ncbi:hypothetical protein MP228_011961 [Amoeboaphelidium protococcarum]|nr:hypothetical protein MP228_011961 [Amoeboaphelidium protococcarum]
MMILVVMHPDEQLSRVEVKDNQERVIVTLPSIQQIWMFLASLYKPMAACNETVPVEIRIVGMKLYSQDYIESDDAKYARFQNKEQTCQYLLKKTEAILQLVRRVYEEDVCRKYKTIAVTIHD